MKFGILFLLGLTGIMYLNTPGRGELAQLRLATEQFRLSTAAQAAGYNFMSNVDNCNQNLGGAGYQYVNLGLIDTTVDFLHPEALIYVPAPNGALQLGAVEYIVPVTAWNATHTAEWPQLMGQQFHLNSTLGAYVLHVWIWKDNPSGTFEDWNPDVACA